MLLHIWSAVARAATTLEPVGSSVAQFAKAPGAHASRSRATAKSPRTTSRMRGTPPCQAKGEARHARRWLAPYLASLSGVNEKRGRGGVFTAKGTKTEHTG